MWRRHWDHTDLERIDDMQRIGCLPTWLIAFFVPATLAGLGILVIDAQTGYFPARASGLVRVTGGSAFAFGIALIAAGLFCHVRFGWTNWRLLHIFANPAMVIALLAFLAAVGYLIVRLASGAMYYTGSILHSSLSGSRIPCPPTSSITNSSAMTFRPSSSLSTLRKPSWPKPGP